MCAAIARLREAAGISNNELSRLLGIVQGTSWKYEHTREPGYQEVQAIEKVLKLPQGTLFAAAGYAPVIDAVDAVHLDSSLNEAQRRRIVEAITRARGKRRVHQAVDSAAMVHADTSLPDHDRLAIARMIESDRYTNQSKISGSKR